MFESHAGILGTKQFEEFSLLYLTQIANKLRERLQQSGLPNVPLVSGEREREFLMFYVAGDFHV